MARSPIFDGVNPALLAAIKRVGDSYGPYGVRITSGYRPGSGQSLHGRHQALDVELYDKKTGKALPNYQNAQNAAQYQQFAHAVYADAAKNDPQLAKQLRWGGYFGNDAATGKPKYGSFDLMHFDTGSNIGMRGGSFAQGFSPEMQKYWGIPAMSGGETPSSPSTGPGNIYASTAGPQGPVGTSKPTASTAPVSGDPRGMAPYIRQAALKYGIDPEVALKVAKSEGLSAFSGDGGKSGGAFQLYTGGGLGNEFQKATGLDPLDPKNEQATIDYALKHASQNGWGSWYGAAKVGVGDRDGIGTAPKPDAAAGYGGIGSDTVASDRAAAAQPPLDPTPNVGSGSSGYDSTPAKPDPDLVASTKPKKDYGDSFGSALADLGNIYAKGPVAVNAARATGSGVLPIQQAIPGGITPMVDPKMADAQRQQLALAMQRLNSGRLV